MGKCSFCGSTAYGNSCVYSPTGVHMHMDEPDKCIYCGSTNNGVGCPFNPYGEVHIKGVAIYKNMREQVDKSAVLLHLLENLEKKSKKKYKSPLDRFYRKVAEAIQKNSEPFLDALKMQNSLVLENMNDETQEFVTELYGRLEDNIKDLQETLKYANSTLPQELVEKLLLGAIISANGST